MVEERTMRVAVIDCGTNSIRLLIADIEGTNFREVTRLMEVVRLGQGVDKTGQFHPARRAKPHPCKTEWSHWRQRRGHDP